MSTKAWRCTVCGYIHRDEDPLDICPLCGAPWSDFEPYEEPETAAQVEETVNQWRCRVCNYIHEGPEPPDICPLCGATAEEFEPFNKPAPLDTPSTTEVGEHIVIIGGGIAAVSSIEAISQASSTSKITLISNEAELPYYRLNLTRYLAGDISDSDLAIHPASWYEDRNVTVMLNTEVIDISSSTKSLDLNNGEAINYDKLILAMGAHPFVPPIPGAGLKGVMSLRTADDAREMVADITSESHVVCIGGGLLGLETAGALAQRGANVTLLEEHPWLMPRQLCFEAGEVLKEHVKKAGIHLEIEAVTKEIVGEEHVQSVLLGDGRSIAADMVVLATGVRSNTYLARQADLDVNMGVVVDNRLQSSVEDIYAVGDVAEHQGVMYGSWAAAQYQGKTAGLNAIGTTTEFGGIPRAHTLKVLGVGVMSVGVFQPEDGSSRVIEADDKGNYQRYVFRDGHLVGAILMGNMKLSSKVRKAIESQRDFSGVLSSNPSVMDINAFLDH